MLLNHPPDATHSLCDSHRSGSRHYTFPTHLHPGHPARDTASHDHFADLNINPIEHASERRQMNLPTGPSPHCSAVHNVTLSVNMV